jgi:nitroimidazol reductase NimA-like FMN-containing flavoprotein (pyridoxamine 5'-phosphate oxidase superfamily)
MPTLPLTSSSAWDTEATKAFLEETQVPIRLGILNDTQEPLVVPLWFYFDGSRFWCACQETSHIIGLISRQEDHKQNKSVPCSFDISTNEPPYRGVRGQGKLTLHRNMGEQTLHRLTARYLQNTNSGFAKWLFARADSEIAIEISPTRLTSWDFSVRMGKSDGI